jgi:hypothetical protein
MAQNDIEPHDEQGTMAKLSPAKRRLIHAHEQIVHQKPDRSDFLHTVMCQVGMPRKSTDARLFERNSGPYAYFWKQVNSGMARSGLINRYPMARHQGW